MRCAVLTAGMLVPAVEVQQAVEGEYAELMVKVKAEQIMAGLSAMPLRLKPFVTAHAPTRKTGQNFTTQPVWSTIQVRRTRRTLRDCVCACACWCCPCGGRTGCAYRLDYALTRSTVDIMALRDEESAAELFANLYTVVLTWACGGTRRRGEGGSSRASLQEDCQGSWAPGPSAHARIKCQQTLVQYTLYQECGCLHLISQWTRLRARRCLSGLAHSLARVAVTARAFVVLPWRIGTVSRGVVLAWACTPADLGVRWYWEYGGPVLREE
eukprot:3613360-Rhodomonas_salina.6